MTVSADFSKKDLQFCIKPSTRELHEMDILCFRTPWNEKDYIEMQKNTLFNCWLFEIRNMYKVGLLVFSIFHPELEILKFGIHPRWRKRGLAEKMIDSLELIYEKDKVNCIFLEVHCENKSAISLYYKKGFKEIGRRKNYFKNPSGDAILLKKLL